MTTTQTLPGNRGTLHTVDRALDVLEHMARATEAKSLATLSAEFGRSKATMHRILASLKERGFVVQDNETGFYRFGWACGRLANQAKQGISLSELCLPFMRELWRRTEETVYLTLQQGGQAVAVEALQSPKPVVATSILGQVLPAHAVSAGLVLLASQPDGVVDRFLKGSLPIYTPRTITDPTKLRSRIKAARREGFAVNRESYRPGVCGIAAPVRLSREGPVVIALSVCMPKERFDLSLKRDVIWAAESASDVLESYFDGRGKRTAAHGERTAG